MSKVLTVSVAAYNVGAYLAETLESCIVSNADRLEVIVVNDGSADGTLQVARDFERRIPGTFKVIDKPNGGYGSTINASLAVASGKYFRFLDGDDWLDTEALRSYLDVLGTFDEDVVFTPYTRVYEDGSPEETIDDLPGIDEGRLGIAGLQGKADIAACAMAYRTDLLRTTGFKMTERCFYTDVEYACLPFSHVKTVRVLGEPLYRYRIGREGQSVSSAGIERHWEDIVRVCARLLSELGDAAFDASEYLGMSVAKECLAPYYFITMVPPTSERKKALIGFDRKMKESPRIYGKTSELSRTVRVLRSTRFLAYSALCHRHSGGEG